LLRLISKLENVDNGTISVNKNYSLAYSFQDIRLFPWLTVFENIAYGINSKDFDKKKNAPQISNLIEKMELTEHVDKYPNELSGGQQQRVGLLRALVAQSDVLLLDEPLTGLDDNLKKKIIEILSLWISEHHPIVIWATHENIAFENLKVRDIIL
jgi:ABC-type nitrate/sulfonate/bicarbonate transport system ATPase subunit